MLVSSQSAVLKGGHGFEMSKHGGDWEEIQNGAHRVRGIFTQDQACFWLFAMCLASPTQKLILGKSTTNTMERGKSRFDEVLE